MAEVHMQWPTKATMDDFDSLNPKITYRHVQSYSLGVRDPLRVVALCDADAFYAACEVVRLGVDRNLPLVVLQWDSLIAVNYPARKYGISRMDKPQDAKKQCPDLIVVHVATYKEGEKEPGYWDDIDSRTHKVSLDYYRRESMKILNMFKDGLPDAEIEKASIDEAFIDFTRPVRTKILEMYPHLATVPDDAPDGIDTEVPLPPPLQWNDTSALVPISPSEPESAAGSDPKEDQPIPENSPTTWHDVALSFAAEMISKVRIEIYDKLGYSLSAGIARNKFLAKLTASYRKPMQQTVLRNAAIPNYLRPIPFQKIRFLGGKLGIALAKEYDASTVGDLLTVGLEELQSKFGEHAIWVYELLRGIDRFEVKEKSFLFKSMLSSKNLFRPVRKPSEAHRWIRVLAAELALRLNDARETNPTLWPKTISLHVRQGYEWNRSKQSSFPFVREVTVDAIASAGDRLWKELVGNIDTKLTPMKITNMQLAFTGMEMADVGQQSIEGFFKPDQQALKRPRPANETEEHDAEDNNNADTNPSADESSSAFFDCPRCNKRVFLSRQAGEDDRVAALEVLKMEHNDFHFAQELAKTPDEETQVQRAIKKKKRENPQGIAKFFSPRKP